MKEYNRRNFIKTVTFGVGALRLTSIESNSFSPSLTVLSNPSLPKMEDQTFDPWLDKNCKIISPSEAKKWDGLWMWYPGQKTAHIHSRMVHDAMKRCNNMSYPGSFCQSVYYVFFRKHLNADTDSEILWEGPLSRIRMSIDGKEGNITSRRTRVKAGTHLIEAKIDFSERLPCILIDGTGLSSPDGWQTGCIIYFPV